MRWLRRLFSRKRVPKKEKRTPLHRFFSQEHESFFQALERALIAADVGSDDARALIGELEKLEKADRAHVKEALKKLLVDRLHPYVGHWPEKRPAFFLFVGLNGSGKTTSVAKLAHFFQSKGEKVSMVAGDMFRAAAVAQLQSWGKRLHIPVQTQNKGDMASLAYRAWSRALNGQEDVVCMDTAGRMHNNENLMGELEKVVRVLKKRDPNILLYTVMVLDGTGGQNLPQQVKSFEQHVPISGFFVTKLDGLSKGGVLLRMVRESQKPIYALGLGETVHDMTAFHPRDFVEGLFS